MSSLNAHASALVTGGAGFIGSNLVEELLKKGVRVRVLDDFSTGHEHNLAAFSKDLEIIRGDIRDAEKLQQACKKIDFVFHVAALPSVPRSVREPILCAEINIMGTVLVFEAARKAGCQRIVFSASSSAYGETAQLPKHEEMAPQPLSPYAVSKLTCEHFGQIYTRIFNLPVVSLRYFNVYGPRQDPLSDYAAVIPLFIRAFRSKQSPTIFGDGEQTRDFTFVNDVVDANLKAALAEKAGGETINIAGGEKITVTDLAKRVAGVIGTSLSPHYAPARAGDIRHSYASIDKAQKVLGWKPQTPLDQGLRRTAEWFASQKI